MRKIHPGVANLTHLANAPVNNALHPSLRQKTDWCNLSFTPPPPFLKTPLNNLA